MIYVIATLTTKPGALDQLRDAVKACRDETVKEAGCMAYDFHVDIFNPQRLVVVEKWETREALTAHSKTPHLARWREASGPLTLERKIEIVHPEKVEQF